ncbi:MAG TPA: class I SAM-dependent methyltransferase [Stellaceae bacterium]|nr:class I SAM-dependent methyltransferase [Stellaceae bacterium]
MKASPKQHRKPYKGMRMEGMLATWYAKNTANLGAEFRACAERIDNYLAAGAEVLEVAPGPGYLAIELARLGRCRITGLDISQSFVRIAAEKAARASVSIEFRQGDVAAMPFPENRFDFVVCRAAFKNFSAPGVALTEMYRVLRPGGAALVIDMRRDASDEAIDETVTQMRLGALDAFVTRAIFKHALRRRAYLRQQFEAMVAATPFGRADIREAPLGFEVWLHKALTRALGCHRTGGGLDEGHRLALCRRS